MHRSCSLGSRQDSVGIQFLNELPMDDSLSPGGLPLDFLTLSPLVARNSAPSLASRSFVLVPADERGMKLLNGRAVCLPAADTNRESAPWLDSDDRGDSINADCEASFRVHSVGFSTLRRSPRLPFACAHRHFAPSSEECHGSRREPSLFWRARVAVCTGKPRFRLSSPKPG